MVKIYMAYNNIDEILSEDALPKGKFKFGYWYVRHKVQLKIAFIVFMIIINTAMIGYAGYYYLDFYVLSADREQAMFQDLTRNFVNFSEYWNRNKPSELIIGQPRVKASLTEDYYDVFAQVSNPNNQWYVQEIIYKLILNTGQELTKEQKTFILPMEEKYLMDLNVQSEQRPSSADIEIVDVKWKRTLNYEPLALSRLNFEVSDLELINKMTIAEQEITVPAKLKFKVYNNTPFNYWEVALQIVSQLGSQARYVDSLTISQFKAGEVREVELSLYENIGSVANLNIIPVVDILNPATYMSFERSGVIVR